jgi:hypothetical protein
MQKLEGVTITKATLPTTIQIGDRDKPIIKIQYDGRVFWNGREVETDQDFRAAMLDLVNFLKLR